MLITKMTLVFGFGAPGRRRRHFKFGLMRFCSSKEKFRERELRPARPGQLPEPFLGILPLT